MPEIDAVSNVVSDASVALKWFHEEGGEDVNAARGLLEYHRSRQIVLHVLDLTYYEVGNALMRGRLRSTAGQTATVLAALRDICLTISPDDDDLALAADLVAQHDLTLYDAVYAAVAHLRRAPLATLDHQLLDAGLGIPPGQLLAHLAQANR